MLPSKQADDKMTSACLLGHCSVCGVSMSVQSERTQCSITVTSVTEDGTPDSGMRSRRSIGCVAARGRRERRSNRRTVGRRVERLMADARGTFASAAVCHRTSRGVVTFFCAVANVTGRDYELARYRAVISRRGNGELC